jgi:2-dehydropantoate 2-reductase
VTNGRDLRGERLTIVGAGAIGGTVGAYLDDAGYDVLLVDADPAHVTVVKERGLKITGCRGEKTFRPRIVLPEDLNGSLGAVFLCVKGHHTASAMDQIAPQLAPKGWILSLQNGLNETQMRPR